MQSITRAAAHAASHPLTRSLHTLSARTVSSLTREWSRATLRPQLPSLLARTIHSRADSQKDVAKTEAERIDEVVKNAPASIRSVIVKLLHSLSSQREVDHYLRHYGNPPLPGEKPQIAVIKVGGGLIRDELDTLVASLSFLVDVGLMPVVVHGAGPQLNAKLEAKGVVSEYHGGIRVTTPEILSTARQTFQEENMKLLEALENRGVRCRGFTSGVFQAEMLDFNKFQYVGEVTQVDTRLIEEHLTRGVVPVITCLAEASSGQLLNVNADVAAHQLAKTLQPIKVVYLSQAGGLKTPDGKIIDVIDLEDDYNRLMNEEWFTHGNRLKLKEIKQLMAGLPHDASVSITSAEQLPRELFTHKGSGTLVKRSDRISHHATLTNVDIPKLTALLEASFHGELDEDFFPTLEQENILAGMVVNDAYTATAIITHLKQLTKEDGVLSGMAEGLDGVAYLDKFAVMPSAQGTGISARMWSLITQKHPAMVWRSRKDNPINAWYFTHSDGSYTPPGGAWTVFWYGLEDMKQAEKAVNLVLAKSANLKRHSITHENAPRGAFREYSTATRRNRPGMAPGSPSSWGVRRFSTSTSAGKGSGRRTRVGLIGARGYTGGELIQLLANHPDLELVSANSRALVGQTLESVVPQLNKFGECDWKQLKFGNLSPSELHKAEADLWVMALPNGVAKPFVESLTSGSQGNPIPKIIDLSADYRFDSSWTYGLPEAKGNRELLRGADRVSNPGCYATAMQLALLPLLPLLSPGQTVSAFGVSGYSGAGTTPSRKNDVNELKDNLMPYAMNGHIHEREVVRHLSLAGANAGLQLSQEKVPLHFVPHVAPWFRGITMTITADLAQPKSDQELVELFQSYYAGEPLVRVSDEVVEVAFSAGTCGAILSVHNADSTQHPGRIVVCATLDNLLKGAASQCMQNINLQFGYEEMTSVPLPEN